MVRQSRVKMSMGRVTGARPSIFDKLSDKEFENLQSIGYSGKTLDGIRVTREDFLNSLGNGSWNLCLIRTDSGAYSDEYVVVYSEV